MITQRKYSSRGGYIFVEKIAKKTYVRWESNRKGKNNLVETISLRKRYSVRGIIERKQYLQEKYRRHLLSKHS